MSYKIQELLTLREHLCVPLFFYEVRDAHRFLFQGCVVWGFLWVFLVFFCVFLCFFFVFDFFLSSSCVLSTQCLLCLTHKFYIFFFSLKVKCQIFKCINSPEITYIPIIWLLTVWERFMLQKTERK